LGRPGFAVSDFPWTSEIGAWSSPKTAPKEQANKYSSMDPNGYSWVYDNRKPETGSRNGNSGLEARDGP
jgi:hypothetical protein